MEIFGHVIVFLLACPLQFLWRAVASRGFNALITIAIAVGGVAYLGWWALLTMIIGMTLGPVLARPQ